MTGQLPSLPCPVCGRRMPTNLDGSRRAHRVVGDDYTSPYCPGGGDPRRNVSGT